MSVKSILYKAGSKIGYDSANPQQRAVLLRLLNEAARECYMQSDMPGSLMEQVFKVNGDQTITMPSYVGAVRAIRELASYQVWHINQMRPRYNQFNWQDMWRNFRLRNTEALQTSVTNASVGVISVPLLEPLTAPLQVTVTGPTTIASQISETVIMDNSAVLTNGLYLKSTVNSFTDYVAVKKNIITQYDVTLQDIDNKVLTVIPNTEYEAIYQVLDISSCPWLPQSNSTLDNYVEILYKQKLKYLSNDGDEFPAFNYDDVLVNKILQLYHEEQNKPDIATAYDTKATRTMARLHQEQNKATEDLIALVSNPHDSLLRRIGTGLRRRYNLYAGRKY